MRVELETIDARRAWNLYWTARSPISALMFALEPIALSRYETSITAHLIRVLQEEVSILEARRIKDAQENAGRS
jgi:hypothetical protein